MAAPVLMAEVDNHQFIAHTSRWPWPNSQPAAGYLPDGGAAVLIVR